MTWSCLSLQHIHRITKSPNVWGWKAHLEVTSPTLLKQGHLELPAQDQVQLVSDVSKEWDSTTSLASCAMFSNPQSRNVFSVVQTEPPVFQYVPIPFWRGNGHHWDGSGSIFIPSHQVFIHTVKTHPEPPLPQTASSLSASPYVKEAPVP